MKGKTVTKRSGMSVGYPRFGVMVDYPLSTGKHTSCSVYLTEAEANNHADDLAETNHHDIIIYEMIPLVKIKMVTIREPLKGRAVLALQKPKNPKTTVKRVKGELT